MSEEEALATDEEQTTSEGEEQEQDLTSKLKQAVQVEVEDLGALRRKMTVTIPRSLLDEQTEEQFADLSRTAQVPGFRPGRAPRRLIEKRFGREVGDQLKGRMLSSGYLAAVEKAELKTISDPLIWVGPGQGGTGTDRLVNVEQALDELVMPAEGDLSFACEVEVRPEFDLPALEKIPLKKPRVSVTEKEVKERIDRFRAMRGTFEPVKGKIKADDLIVADVKMSVEGEVAAQEDNMQLAARGQSVFGVPLPELGKEMAGKEAGGTVRLEVDIPEDYEKAELRTKKAAFEIAIHDVKRLALPPVDDAFLSSLGFDSEQELKAWVRDDLESRLNEAVRQNLRSQMYQHLLDTIELELPEGMSSRQTDRVVMRRILELRRQGLPDAEISKYADELRTGAKDEAAKQLKMSFILEKIAEERDVQVSEEEVNTQIAQIAARYNRRFDRVRDDLAKGDGLASLYIHIRDEKIIDLLIADAEITESEPAKKREASKRASSKKKTATKKSAKSKTSAKTSAKKKKTTKSKKS
jgi:trigger factor